jgi:hypothetical protein
MKFPPTFGAQNEFLYRNGSSGLQKLNHILKILNILKKGKMRVKRGVLRILRILRIKKKLKKLRTGSLKRAPEVLPNRKKGKASGSAMPSVAISPIPLVTRQAYAQLMAGKLRY